VQPSISLQEEFCRQYGDLTVRTAGKENESFCPRFIYLRVKITVHKDRLGTKLTENSPKKDAPFVSYTSRGLQGTDGAGR
jgi:hypothetical protein